MKIKFLCSFEMIIENDIRKKDRISKFTKDVFTGEKLYMDGILEEMFHFC